ncbi:hypothetical protein MmiHf6_08900 [Methanimicrococcus hongohii]|uniref:Uncharacterized protein n=1 Tax=Methanimicrococcus hongohii TaxID=3028295 RepID=A0AA96V8X0_9EURY|nr:hypothetical protein [Methanimicrococcus sp. Hf6]WNY23581.1 hypothetical protein MmiHf6_08900 [Methanimicrococcus sp. Hf6]
MNSTEQKLAEIIEYQKQLVDIGNYNYYQSAIDNFFYPAEILNVEVKSQLQILRVEFTEDYKTNPPFVKASISRYSDRLAEILDYYVGTGKFHGRLYPHLGKKQIKNSIEVIVTLESIKNKLVDIVVDADESDIEELCKSFDKVDKLISENISLSKSFIKDISKKMTAINIRLDRDLTNSKQ